jgi:hypothetical protein
MVRLRTCGFLLGSSRAGIKFCEGWQGKKRRFGAFRRVRDETFVRGGEFGPDFSGAC